MPRNSLRIQDAKLLTFGQVAEVLSFVIEHLEKVCPPDNDIDSCLAVSDVANMVTERLVIELRETLEVAAMSLMPLPPWVQQEAKR